MGDNGSLVKFICVNSSRCHLVSGNKVVTHFLVRNSRGEFMFCFQADGGGQGAYPASAFSHLLSVQNDPHARMAYLGVAYSEPL